MMSKFTKKAPTIVTTPRSPKPKKITRRERTNRMFKYRGVSFIAVRSGDRVFLSTLDEDTKSTTPAIEIPREKLNTATKALAKIVLAEKDIQEIILNSEKESNS